MANYLVNHKHGCGCDEIEADSAEEAVAIRRSHLTEREGDYEMYATIAEAEPVCAAHIDEIIWGMGNSEDAAIADGTDWLSRNGDSDDAKFLKADQCDTALAEDVKNCGGQVRWEWAQHPGHRHMQLRAE